MFLGENAGVRLLSVFETCWGESHVDVKGRNFSALSLRLQGDSRITEGGRLATLATGDVLYMPAGADYHLDAAAEKILVVHFEVNGECDGHMRAYSVENSLLLQRIFLSMFEIWNRKLPGYYFRTLALFYQVLGELEAGDSGTSGTDREKIRSAVEYIHAHYNDPELSVPALAKMSFMSDTYFRRLFVRVFGKTPLAYINDLRIDYAKELLREWNSSVWQTAGQAGFSDAKYFSTVFRKRVGVSPSVYQKNI